MAHAFVSLPSWAGPMAASPASFGQTCKYLSPRLMHKAAVSCRRPNHALYRLNMQNESSGSTSSSADPLSSSTNPVPSTSDASTTSHHHIEPAELVADASKETEAEIEKDFVFSKGAVAIVLAYLPSFLGLLRSLILKTKVPGGQINLIRTMLIVALLLLNPDLASSAAVELTHAKMAIQKASKRKPLLRRVKPVVDQYKLIVIVTCLLSAIGFSIAAFAGFDNMKIMSLGAFIVVLGQNMFHALARVKINNDGGLRETSPSERVSVLSVNGVSMVLLMLAAAGVDKVTPVAVSVFCLVVFLYVVVKKTLQIVERLVFA
eukprot:CAMPEP_0184691686 /NCGR_PEP_ID=MMETSP0313-20130426/456_1 /TAXON_ID=2792 /ORGANISM="Porphyridium aerugineum, Strain SAG 1380-2" /LENGTH=318 /DNA_ID=CAMNT_0027149443 /DNA_START=62 /DNA_END=1018 /DNA_ORIENTATION=-